MTRIAWLTSALFGVAAVADARQHAARNADDVVLSKSMSDSLAQIAAPYLEESEIGALVDLSAPKDQMIAQIDAMQKQIIAECNQEQQSFNDWLATKQNELYNNQQQLKSLQAHQADLQTRVDSIQGQIIGSQGDQNTLQAQLADAQATLAKYQQQLQEATDLRAKTRAQNLALIKQHKDALQALADLRAMVAALNTDSDAMAKLEKASVLKKKDVKISGLIESVKQQLAQFKSNDPQVKAALKAKLLGLIDQIAQGVQESLTLYQQQEDSQQQKFDNEIKPGLQQIIAQAQAQIDSIQAKLAQVVGNIGSLSSDLEQAKADLVVAITQVANMQALITTLQQQITDGQATHAQKQTHCKADLDALEQVRQFIVNNIQGMTPGNNCNPQSLNCERCLYDAHCPNGQTCTDQGTCGIAPTTAPPKGPYYQLLPKSPPTPWSQGRRVDVGVVPPASFNLPDFTYIFKYQQLQPANGWANLFNVLNVGDGWPFPNQAALFLTGNMFEIDVCQNGMPWPASYWYRNFNQQQVVLNAWTAVAFVVSSSTRTLSLSFRDAQGNVRTQKYPDFHGNPAKFATTGAWVNGRGYNSLVANFADFRRYDSALSDADVLSVFKEFFA